MKKSVFSGAWKVDILEIAFILLKRSQVRSVFCFCSSHSSYWPPVSSCSLSPLSPPSRWPAVVHSSPSSLPFFSPARALRHYNPTVIDHSDGRWVGGGELWWGISTPEIYSRANLNRPREHTHTLARWLEVLSQVTPNLSHSEGVKRSGYLLWRGSLSVFGPGTHTHTHTHREFVSFHLIFHSTNWNPSLTQCVVMINCKRRSWQLIDINETHLSIRLISHTHTQRLRLLFSCFSFLCHVYFSQCFYYSLTDG